MEINNFRGISKLKIENFRSVNLLVGKNNSCKTTVLEALFLLTGSSNAELPLRVNSYRGLKVVDSNIWRTYFRNLDIKQKIELKCMLRNPLEKRILLIKPRIRSVISVDNLEFEDAFSGESSQDYIDDRRYINGLSIEFTYSDKATLSPSDRKKGKKPIKVLTEVYGTLKGIELKAPQNYIEKRRGIYITHDTLHGNIRERFNNIQVRKELDRIIKILQSIEPNLKDLALGSGNVVLCDVGLDRMVPINILGDGMNRLLSIILALADTQDGVIFIDEVDTGFHYSTLGRLWKVIFESSKEFNVQVIASTHSLDCVKTLSNTHKENKLDENALQLFRIVRSEDDKFTTVTYTSLELKEFIEKEWEIR